MTKSIDPRADSVRPLPAALERLVSAGNRPYHEPVRPAYTRRSNEIRVPDLPIRDRYVPADYRFGSNGSPATSRRNFETPSLATSADLGRPWIYKKEPSRAAQRYLNATHNLTTSERAAYDARRARDQEIQGLTTSRRFATEAHPAAASAAAANAAAAKPRLDTLHEEPPVVPDFVRSALEARRAVIRSESPDWSPLSADSLETGKDAHPVPPRLHAEHTPEVTRRSPLEFQGDEPVYQNIPQPTSGIRALPQVFGTPQLESHTVDHRQATRQPVRQTSQTDAESIDSTATRHLSRYDAYAHRGTRGQYATVTEVHTHTTTTTLPIDQLSHLRVYGANSHPWNIAELYDEEVFL